MMQIGDLAAKAGVTARTIRFYEELGIITPEERTEGGFRLYSDDQLVRLNMVLGLKALGFDLDRVRSLFRLNHECQTAGELAKSLTEHLQEQQREIDDKMARYQAIKDRNEKAIEVLKGCCHCPVRSADPANSDCYLYRGHPRVPDSISCANYDLDAEGLVGRDGPLAAGTLGPGGDSAGRDRH